MRRTQKLRKYVVVMWVVMTMALAGCGGGSVCCGQEEQGNTVVIIQSEDRAPEPHVDLQNEGERR